MITVHHLNNSRSQRVLWLLEELGLPYEIKFYQRDPKTMLAPPELFKIHPLGKSPVITDGDTVIAESGHITSYLVETYGAGRLIPPAGTPERQQYDYWVHYAEGSAMPPLVLKLIFLQIPKQPMPLAFLVRPIVKRIAAEVQKVFIDPNIANHVKFWETELAKSTWFAGAEFTAADIMMSFPLEAAGSRFDLTKTPRVGAVLKAMQARPAYRRALERGGPYEYGPH